MVVSITPLPVIGVPVKTSSLDGMDSLCINSSNARRVPLQRLQLIMQKMQELAAQILGVKYDEIREKIEKYKNEMTEEVEKKAQKLEEIEYTEYLKPMGK